MINTFISIIISLLGVFITIIFIDLLVNWRISRHKVAAPSQLAYNIIKATYFVVAGILFSEAVAAFIAASKLLPAHYEGGELLMKQTYYCSLYVGISITAAIISILASGFIYSSITKGGKVFIDAAENNPRYLLNIGIVIALTIVSKSVLGNILEQMVPYSNLPFFR